MKRLLTILACILGVVTTVAYSSAETPPAAPNSPIVTATNLTPTTLEFVSEKTRADFRIDISVSNWISTYNVVLLECKDFEGKVLGANSIGINSTENDQIYLNAVTSCTFPAPGSYKIEVHLRTEGDDISNTVSQDVLVMPAP